VPFIIQALMKKKVKQRSEAKNIQAKKEIPISLEEDKSKSRIILTEKTKHNNQ
jgi:hypothetical protein